MKYRVYNEILLYYFSIAWLTDDSATRFIVLGDVND
jgi:hypothetical protein